MSMKLENITTNDFAKVCRSCLSIIHLRPLFDNTSKCDLLRKMLMNYTRLTLHVDDILPKQICDQCSKKLIDFASFISNCNKINHALLQLIDATSIKYQSTAKINNTGTYEIYEEVKDPSIVTQTFKNWLNDFQQSHQNLLTENYNFTNVSKSQTNEISANKTINKEVETLYEIKEEIVEDETLENIHEEKRLDFVSGNVETKEDEFEYIEVKTEENEDVVELPTELNTNLSGEVYKNLHKNDVTKPKKFNCRMCNMFFDSINDFLTHCLIHRGQEGLDVQQQENKSSIPKPPVTIVKKYMCNMCLKVYNTKQDLTKHKKCHGNIEERCEVCLKRFPNLTELSKHALTHLPLKKKQNDLVECTYWSSKTQELSHKGKQITINNLDSAKSSKRKLITIANSVDSLTLPKLSKKGASEIVKDALEQNKEKNNSYYNSFLSYIEDPEKVVRLGNPREFIKRVDSKY